MRKIIPIITLLTASAIISINIFNNKEEGYKESLAYDNTSLPTTIDLNDCDEETIKDYYSSISLLKDEERSGDNLLKNLKTLLSKDQKYFSYDINSGLSIWRMYEITDRDWDKSPADQIPEEYGHYDASTNTITNYKYGSSASKPGSNPYVHALYVNRDIDNKMTAWDNHKQTAWGINREHIWPKSHGFGIEGEGDTGGAGARGDPMHLWAADGNANREHNFYYYGYVDTSKTYVDCGDKEGFSYSKGNLRGRSKTLPSVNEYFFEPQDSDKGDIARALFYMAARYNNIANNDNTIDIDNPNLLLSDDVDMSTGISTPTKSFKYGLISDLLEWNKIDPVDEYEIHRNNLLYKNFTNNRNPFIDYPEWADNIWGDKKDESVDPESDLINNNAIISEVSSLTIDSANKSVKFKVSTIDNSKINWSITSGKDVISIDKEETNSGEELTITSLKAGNAKLTAKAKIDGKDYERTFSIVVNGEEAKKGLDMKTILIVVACIVAALILFIIIFSLASKKNKKKMVNKAKKYVKKSVKTGSKNKKR